jgi:hypothetical protein
LGWAPLGILPGGGARYNAGHNLPSDHLISGSNQPSTVTRAATAKSFDIKLARILADPSCRDFILADAKDADMAMGLAAPGPAVQGSPLENRSLAQYRDLMREIVRQGLVDIMLMSPSSAEVLAIDERLFEDSPVTPAARANDATDIWLSGSGSYARQPSRAFRSAMVPELQSAWRDDAGQPRVDLGLYSITLNNDASLDRETLERYGEFRREATAAGFRHFLEVFAPNAPVQPIADVPRFVCDSIARLLAGIPRAARPLFLKIPYFGPAAMERLCHYDRSLVVGVLGGSAGTTLDAFQLVAQAKRHGARAALFGRKVNLAEDQLAFVRFLRAVADDELPPEEATRAYHGELHRQGIHPRRSLADDLQATQSWNH